MRIEIRNSFSRVWGDESERAELDEATSYPVEGAEFVAAFKAGFWDGREHLLRKARKQDYHLIPTGVLVGLDDILSKCEVTDGRRKPGERVSLEWVEQKSLRQYQTDAIESVLKDRGIFTGRGMWSLPIRSGKTLTAAGLIQRLGLRTVFVVSSKALLGQTERAFRAALEPCPVGVFGDGRHETDWITIATAQSLLAKPEIARKLLTECDLLIVDEAHHLEGEAWRNLALMSDARYKIGLSATIFVSQDRKNNTASIWLRACTGPILYRVSMGRLIKAGFLKKPTILFYRCEQPPDIRGKDWQWTQRERLANSQKRNNLIADLAVRAARQGKRVMVDTGRKDQMKNIRDAIARRNTAVEMIHGATPTSRRDELVSQMSRGEIILVGTVLGEGIDIPELEVVINAEGQKSQTAATQRMRNMTQSDGKGDIHFIDIADIGNPILQRHSMERLKFYKAHRGFTVLACVYDVPGSDPFAAPITDKQTKVRKRKTDG